MDMNAWTTEIAFVCPRCRGAMVSRTGDYWCGACSAHYPVVSGIADFRIAPDPWIDLEADREKALRLERETAGQSFEEMVRAYWSMTPGTPSPLAETFIAHVRAAETRTREWLHRTGAPSRSPGSAGMWLDVGCGTADLAAAVGPGIRVVGIDIAFRWLVVARRRLQERRIAALLVCCNAEALPFADAAFAHAFSLGALEHCRDAVTVLRETRRVLASGGEVRIRTANRFSALPEPHVNVWGVGWLPRRWADPYVNWRIGERYLHHWPKSAREIYRAMRRVGFEKVRVDAAPMLLADLGRLITRLRPLIPAYERLRTTPGVRTLMRVVAPVLEASGTAR